MGERVGSAVAAYHTSPGISPKYGFTTFHYYDNEHWRRFDREGTACGPAAVATAARFIRGKNLGELELDRAVNNLGPAGTNYGGILNMMGDLGVTFQEERVKGKQGYVDRIRSKVKAGRPVIVLVDWGGATPFKRSSWGAHYMIAYGATDGMILFTNIADAPGGQSKNVGFTDERLRGYFSGHLIQLAGFWSLAFGFRLISIVR